MKRHLWAGIFTLMLTAYTVFAALDIFVLSRVYETVDGAAPSQPAAPSEAAVTESSYSDGNIEISLTQYREYDTDIYAAEISLSSAEYLKTALARSAYGKNLTAATSEISSGVGAILAINGDNYGSQEQGYVLRNGVLYRDSSAARQDLVIWADGSFDIIDESRVTAQELLEGGAVQVLSFGPALVENGGIVIDPDDEVGKAKSSNPRTALAVVDPLHYVFIVSDGRTGESAGLSLYQLAQFAVRFKAETVYNLDGGGSSTMYFDGQVVNSPTSSGKSIKERSVSDIVYIGY